VNLGVPARGNIRCSRSDSLGEITASCDQVLTSSYGLILSECGGHQFPVTVDEEVRFRRKVDLMGRKKAAAWGSGEMGGSKTSPVMNGVTAYGGGRCRDAAFT
jgi:hypothetical protein